jgi:hypothetical protein
MNQCVTDFNTIAQSIAGIDKLIFKREARIRFMRIAMNQPKYFSYTNWISFYRCGIKTMKELKRLKQIKLDLEKLIT